MNGINSNFKSFFLFLNIAAMYGNFWLPYFMLVTELILFLTTKYHHEHKKNASQVINIRYFSCFFLESPPETSDNFFFFSKLNEKGPSWNSVFNILHTKERLLVLTIIYCIFNEQVKNNVIQKFFMFFVHILHYQRNVWWTKMYNMKACNLFWISWIRFWYTVSLYSIVLVIGSINKFALFSVGKDIIV